MNNFEVLGMNLIKTAVFTVMATVSVGSIAAKPTSITFDAKHQTEDGTPYSTYDVRCSNGKKIGLTVWDNRRKWCVGDTSSEQCEKKQMKAANAACK